MKTITEKARETAVFAEVDVLVIGSGPSGWLQQ
jgi:ribulose 1,5-bisphosphate synthetase/thiazole synthase